MFGFGISLWGFSGFLSFVPKYKNLPALIFIAMTGRTRHCIYTVAYHSIYTLLLTLCNCRSNLIIVLFLRPVFCTVQLSDWKGIYWHWHCGFYWSWVIKERPNYFGNWVNSVYFIGSKRSGGSINLFLVPYYWLTHGYVASCGWARFGWRIFKIHPWHIHEWMNWLYHSCNNI